MIHDSETNGEKNIVSKAVRQFPSVFKGTSAANHMRAKRIWRSRHLFIHSDGSIIEKGITSTITKNTKDGIKLVRLKSLSGRGRKREELVDALRFYLRYEFDRLRKLGVKFNFSTLKILALSLLNESNNGIYGSELINVPDGKKCLRRLIFDGYRDLHIVLEL